MATPESVKTTDSPRDRLAAAIGDLVQSGNILLTGILDTKPGDVLPFASKYHRWYTQALPVIGTLLPDRLDEFKRQYERNEKRKLLDGISYVIEDFMHGVAAPTRTNPSTYRQEPSFEINQATYVKFNNQIQMLGSAMTRLEEALYNIRGLLQADLFDSELEAARYLAKNGHLRAAGAVAGVVLEGHLGEVCRQHSVGIRKKDPHISDFNDALKNDGIFDVANWRWVQRLGDIRNLCDHKKQREPTTAEVDELISGVEKAIKTLL